MYIHRLALSYPSSRSLSVCFATLYCSLSSPYPVASLRVSCYICCSYYTSCFPASLHLFSMHPLLAVYTMYISVVLMAAHVLWDIHLVSPQNV